MRLPENIVNFSRKNGWFDCFDQFFRTEDGSKLLNFISNLIKSDEKFCPDIPYIFRVFKDMKLEDVKVVILGQDPYHGEDQAIGLAFGVKNNTPRPPSLRNIFKELKLDIGISVRPDNSDLTGWMSQGVLLLNSILTVSYARPGSHANKGWEEFTTHVIQYILNNNKNICICAWGKYAQDKIQHLKIPNNYNYLILKTTHPSPFSAHKGFIGCGHFSQINKFLDNRGCKTIDWGYVSVNGNTKPTLLEYLEKHQERIEA